MQADQGWASFLSQTRYLISGWNCIMRLFTENSRAVVRIWPWGYANAVASRRFNSCHENIKLRPLHLAVRQYCRYITALLFSAKERWLISDKHLHHKIKAWPCLRLGNGTVNISYASKQFFSPNYSLFKAYSCIWYKILAADWVSSVMVSTFYTGWLVNYQYNYSISLLRSSINTAAIVYNSNEYVWILWYTSFLPNIWATFLPTKQNNLFIMKLISICP